MSTDTPERDSFLQELYRASGGDLETHISMYQIGETLGLSKPEVSALSEELIIEGYVELQTLSGAISITPQGLAALGVTGGNEKSNQLPKLSGQEIITDNDRKLLNELLEKVQRCTFSSDIPLVQLEELLVDLKTMEVHLLSTKPKTAVIKALLIPIAGNLKLLEPNDYVSTLNAEIESLVRTEQNSSAAG